MQLFCKANADLEDRDISPSYKNIHFDYFVLNVSSLTKHFIDLKLDVYAQKSDNICVVETWLDTEEQNINRFQIPGKLFEHASFDKGKGCGIFTPVSKDSKTFDKVKKNSFQLLSMIDGCIQLILAYISSRCSLKEVVTELQKIIHPQ